MNKKFLFVLLNLIFLLGVQGSVLTQKVENIIGSDDYKLHKSLIELLLKDEKKYLVHGEIKYYKLFKTLQENGLLNLRLNRPSDIKIEFTSLNKNFKSYKILNDTMQAIGYRYFFTKSMRTDKNNHLIWNIEYKAEYMLDPVVLLNELHQNNCQVTGVVSRSLHHWAYEVDCQNARLTNAMPIEKNERVKLHKPLRAYMFSIEDGKSLQVISRKLNNWFPNIVFFDKDLQVLKIIKKKRVYRGLKVKIPENTSYVKVTDMYNLINIKRGLSIIVR